MSRRLLLFPTFLGVAAAGIMAMAEQGHLSSWKTWLDQLIRPNAPRASAERIKLDLLSRVNYNRIAAKANPLKMDSELQNHLDNYLHGEWPQDLDSVTTAIQNAIPRYFRVSITSASRPSATDLVNEFANFVNNTEPQMTHFASLVKSTNGGLSHTGMVVVGQRLEDFSPEALTNSKTDAFFQTCYHCGHPHISRVSNAQRSMTLACPSCSRTYAVVAADTQGRFRYVNEFLSGYHPPALFPKDQSMIQKLFTIWGAVHSHCDYKLDPETKKTQLDAWQTAIETQNLQMGDCEDSAIYLADWLGSAGFQVRVALGRYGDLGGHAWCVVRLDGHDYLLESTEGRPDPTNPPLADLIGSRYVPEVLFDRKAVYVRAKPRGSWAGDYWSVKTWVKMEPRNPPMFGKTASTQKQGPRFMSVSAQEVRRMFSDRGRVAISEEPAPALAPFADLNTIPNGNRWEMTVSDNYLPPEKR